MISVSEAELAGEADMEVDVATATAVDNAPLGEKQKPSPPALGLTRETFLDEKSKSIKSDDTSSFISKLGQTYKLDDKQLIFVLVNPRNQCGNCPTPVKLIMENF